MSGNRCGKRILLCVAAVAFLCMSGCNTAESSISASTAPSQLEQSEPTDTQAATESVTQPASSPAETTAATEPDGTEPSQTAPPATKPAQTDPPQTEPPQTEPPRTEPPQTEPPQTDPPQTDPAQTEPPQTEPVPVVQIDSQAVIAQAIAALEGRMPELKYDSGWSGVTTVELPVDATIRQEAVADKLLEYLLELFEYDLYLEEPFAYTYSLTYRGITEGACTHGFVVSYTANAIEVPVEEPALDTGAVVAQVTQGILDSTRVSVELFDGSGYTERVVISDVPYFYGVQDAVECLISVAESEIYKRNLVDTVYTSFYFSFDYENETSYVFSLYLK